MNMFTQAVVNHTTTTNGMPTRITSESSLVNFYYNIGAVRGQTARVESLFEEALRTNTTAAIVLAFHSRDVRGGMGERESFRIMLRALEKKSQTDVELTRALLSVIPLIPEYGRWDDILVFQTEPFKSIAATTVYSALVNDLNALAAKWMPRKGEVANYLKRVWKLTNKQYRQMLVLVSNGNAEQLMSTHAWDAIEFSKLPSIAARRYTSAFSKRTETQTRYAEYVEALTEGKATVNANAIFPHDVLGTVLSSYSLSHDIVNTQLIEAQWAALPDYVEGEKKILPLVDVSGSMDVNIPGTNTTAMNVAVSLGLYLCTKNQGDFKDLWLTFSGSPTLTKVDTSSGVVAAARTMYRDSNWGMNTDLHAAFRAILDRAKMFNVPQEDMPETLLILSDMQFDQAVRHHWDADSLSLIQDEYAKYGYTVPTIVYWNLTSKAMQSPASHDTPGVAMVSGFSPAVLQAVFKSETITPAEVVQTVLNDERYQPLINALNSTNSI